MNVLDLADGYPLAWEDFIGQDMVKRQLQVACASAKHRKAPLDHVLLASGMAGVGKTALAFLCANELGTDVQMISGKVGLPEARVVISGMNDHDILIVDEIHRLVQGGRMNAEWLLHLLQDGVLLGPCGPEEMPKITVIGATTDPGRLPVTIIGRFPFRPAIEPYTDDQAAAIASAMTSVFPEVDLPLPTWANCQAIAAAGNNNPRSIKAITINLRDLALVEAGAIHTEDEGYDLTEALEWLGLTPDGLDRVAQRYLIAMLTDFRGQPVGERSIMDRLNEPGGCTHAEAVLMEKGFITKTKQGRMLTQAGMARARELDAAGIAA